MAKIIKIGNSLGVTINPMLLKLTGIESGDDVDITIKGGTITIKKATP